MDKAFIVTSGCYSDYQIERVFSTNEKAEEYIDSQRYPNEFRIEEYCIDDEISIEEKTYVIGVDLISRETSLDLPLEVNFEMSKEEYVDCFSVYEIHDRKVLMYYHESNIRFMCVFAIKSKSAKIAQKSAQDRLVQILAMEDVCYPLMRSKCVINVNDKSYRFPMYNINTKELVLRAGEVEIKNYKY